MKTRKILPLFYSLLVAALLLFGTAFTSFAASDASSVEQWIKTVYNETNGLDTGEANVVLQTADGYIWIGSYGGLLRYDGKNFENFSTATDGVTSSSIRSLFETSDGRLFIGTNDKGVFVYENGTFTHLANEDGSQNFYSVRSFTEGADGTVYAGTSSGLTTIIKTEEGEEQLRIVEGTAGYVIYDLTCATDGCIWACASSDSLLLIAEGALKSAILGSTWLDSDCYSVLASSDGYIYVGSGGTQIAKLTHASEGYTADCFSVTMYDTGALYTVNKMYETADGAIWGLCDNGVGYLTASDGLVTPSGMGSLMSCGSMVEDYEGSIWISSTRTGISYFARSKFINYNDAADLEGISVNAVAVQGSMTYVGTDSGLLILDENHQQVTTEEEILALCSGKRVRYLSLTADGACLVCIYNTGLAVWSTEGITLYTDEEGLLNNQVRVAIELSDGRIAVGGTGGINIIENGVVTESYGADVLPYSYILCMYEAADGTLVAGSDGQGIYEIATDGTITQYYTEAGLDAGSVMRMVPDEDGVWISAGSALYYRDAEGIREIELPTSAGSVLDILLIGDDIWLLKSSGILLTNKADLLAGTAQLRSLGTQYGLTGTIVANAWNYLNEDGSLWICTNNGISIIETDDIPTNGVEPDGIVSKITVDDEIVPVSDEIRVAATAKRITLSISVLSYTPGEKTVEYYLEGFEEATLHDAATLDSVSYTNLSGGTYTFHMVVYNEDGIAGQEFVITIYKAKHFYENVWFVVLMVILGVALLVLLSQCIYQFKVRRIKKKQNEYRSIIEQALHTFAKAIDAKDKDTNGHSIRVAMYARELARRLGVSQDDQEWIFYIALLHDIGKIGIPDSILKKQGKLTPEEYEIIKSHPVIGAEILKGFTAIEDIGDGARYHHERYDGQGYCEGLSGEAIPFKARIIAVADSFDAMCSARVYKDKNSIEYARGEIERCAGTQFDPKVAQAMLTMIDDGFVGGVLKETEEESKSGIA